MKPQIVFSQIVFAMFAAAALTVIGVSSVLQTPDPPEMKAYEEAIPGTQVKFEMLPIPGGVFAMGSLPGESGRSVNEGPQHQVSVAPFWMGKTEVTWEEYDLFAFSQDIEKKNVGAGTAAKKAEPEKGLDAITHPTPPYADETFGFGRDHGPVISVTHHAASEYCAWLSAKTGKTYRLPTEAEWEYACRAGSRTKYSFGATSAALKEHAWYLDNAGGRPHPVGTKKPNAWGLHDMHGNVAEWCLDQYSARFYSRSRPRVASIFPVLLPGEEEYPHVARGGSWDDPAARLRSAARLASNKNWNRRDPQNPQSIWWLTDATTVGFRLVRPLQEQEILKGFRSQTKKGHGPALPGPPGK